MKLVCYIKGLDPSEAVTYLASKGRKVKVIIPNDYKSYNLGEARLDNPGYPENIIKRININKDYSDIILVEIDGELFDHLYDSSMEFYYALPSSYLLDRSPKNYDKEEVERILSREGRVGVQFLSFDRMSQFNEFLVKEAIGERR